MGNTTNNNWPTPVATDLVKDGWEAIKDLGDAIDTTLGVYAPSTPGLTLINTTSFSAVASQSINDVFSATYQNYLILLEYSTPSGGAGVTMKLRVSGTDSSTNYNYQSNTIDGASVSASRQTAATGGWEVSITGTTAQNFAAITLINPFLTATTAGTSIGSSSFNTVYTRNSFFNHTTAASYDGFTIISSAANITGTISTYGYNK
jgi:hypothetical protein